MDPCTHRPRARATARFTPESTGQTDTNLSPHRADLNPGSEPGWSHRVPCARSGFDAAYNTRAWAGTFRDRRLSASPDPPQALPGARQHGQVTATVLLRTTPTLVVPTQDDQPDRTPGFPCLGAVGLICPRSHVARGRQSACSDCSCSSAHLDATYLTTAKQERCGIARTICIIPWTWLQ